MASLRPLVSLAAGLAALLGFAFLARLVHATNPMTAALGLLVIALITGTFSPPWVAVVSSVAGTLCLNYFFLPPVGTFSLADPTHWISLAAFVTVGVVASRLSATAQLRAREAVARRNELGRLFDLSRDILLTEDGEAALTQLPHHVAHRFELDEVALCLPGGDGRWRLHQGGSHEVALAPAALDSAFARADATLEAEAERHVHDGQAKIDAAAGRSLRLVPLRLGPKAVGLLATGASLDPGTADAVAGLVAIAVERSQLLAERQETERVRQKAELASTLLASMSHDLRTPLTAIGVAVENLDAQGLPADQRQAQVRLARSELQRLNRLFRDILDLARIDAAALPLSREWVTAADVIDAACTNLRPELEARPLTIDADESTAVLIDPRLTSAALAHLIENAVQYTPADGAIEVRGWTTADGLQLTVRDHGAGLDQKDLEHIFERFYRGRQGRVSTTGTGMGLAITRGLLAIEGGRVWAENTGEGGARFSIAVPAVQRPVDHEE